MTEKTAASFQRERNPYGINVVTGANSQLYAAARKGSGRHVVWARSGAGVGAVGDYRADGYEIVSPKDVEFMGRGQYFPDKKDYGVYVDFDPKQDRVQTLGGMVLMSCSLELLDEIKREQAELGNRMRRKDHRPIDEAKVQTAGVDMGTEVTSTVESLASM